MQNFNCFCVCFSSPGIPPHLGGWDGETLYAAAVAARHNSATLKIFGRQNGSVFAVSPSSAAGAAVNPCPRRRNKVKQNNRYAASEKTPQVYTCDLNVLKSSAVKIRTVKVPKQKLQNQLNMTQNNLYRKEDSHLMFKSLLD